MLITDINSAGASALTITARSDMQILIAGTWAGATVSLQKYVNSTWITVKDYTADAYDIVESIGSGVYRTFTTGSPTLICDVTFNGINGGSVA